MRNEGGKLQLMITWNQIALADYYTLCLNILFCFLSFVFSFLQIIFHYSALNHVATHPTKQKE